MLREVDTILHRMTLWIGLWIGLYWFAAKGAAKLAWYAPRNTILAIPLSLLAGLLPLAFLWFPLLLVIHTLRGGEGKTDRSSRWNAAAVDGVFGLLYFLTGLALGYDWGAVVRILAFYVVPGISAFALFVVLPLSDWIRDKWEERHPRDHGGHERTPGARPGKPTGKESITCGKSPPVAGRCSEGCFAA